MNHQQEFQTGGRAARHLRRHNRALVLDLARARERVSRAELSRVSGLSIPAVMEIVSGLKKENLIREVGTGPSTGGRPPKVLEFNKDAGVVLAADLGATHCRLSVANLAGGPIAELTADQSIADGPDAVLGWVQERFWALLEEAGVDRESVLGIGIGVPGPVDFLRGQAVNPPIMPGWDNVSIPDKFAESFPDVPVLVDNDVNIMALGEQRAHWPQVEHMLYVKIGTGIGCGIVASGQIHRGARGGAGDIGHIRVPGHEEVVCRCGNIACVEAVAGGRALARKLSDLGFPAENSRDVVALVRAGNPAAARLVRTAGELIGEVLASTVNFFNPEVIVMGGDMAHAHEQLFAGIRTVVYQRSLPLATRHLQLVPSELDDRAGIFGAAMMAVETAMDTPPPTAGGPGLIA
ncbi:ROK family protein [soil metagenome]